jgi:hypothetical protein
MIIFLGLCFLLLTYTLGTITVRGHLAWLWFTSMALLDLAILVSMVFVWGVEQGKW